MMDIDDVVASLTLQAMCIAFIQIPWYKFKKKRVLWAKILDFATRLIEIRQAFREQLADAAGAAEKLNERK
jgi:hypothetical protein